MVEQIVLKGRPDSLALEIGHRGKPFSSSLHGMFKVYQTLQDVPNDNVTRTQVNMILSYLFYFEDLYSEHAYMMVGHTWLWVY